MALPEHLVPPLRAIRLEKALQFVSGCADRLDQVEEETKLETQALGTLAAALQAQREHTALQAATALLACSKDDPPEAVGADDADRQEDRAPGSEHIQVGTDDALRRYARSLLEDTAALRARLQLSAEGDAVPKAAFDALEAELAATKQLCAASAQCLTELRASLTGEPPRFLTPIPAWVASRGPGVMDNDTATYLKHPLWADFVADMEQRLGRQTALEESIARLEGLQPKMELLEKKNADLERQVEDARSDAQVAMYQNGVLVQQMASLLFKHHCPATLPPPVSRSDLAVFGPHRLPDPTGLGLRGAALMAPSGQPESEVVDLQAYSVHDIKELVERNTELSAAVFKLSNSRGAVKRLAHHGGRESDADDQEEGAAGLGKRRFRDQPPSTLLVAAAADPLQSVGGRKRARSSPSEPRAERSLALRSRGEYDQPVLTAEKAVQSDALGALQVWAEQPRSRLIVELKQAVEDFSATDVLGAERLVAAALELCAWGLSGDREMEAAMTEERTLYQSALAEAHGCMEELERTVSEQGRLLALETRVNEQLRSRLAEYDSAGKSEAILSSLDQKLAAPIEALACLERTLRANAPSSEARAAGEALNTLQGTLGEVTAIAESLSQQEDALMNALRVAMRAGPGGPLSNADESEPIEQLQLELGRLRDALANEQHKLTEAKDALNTQRMKTVEMLDHIWRVDVRCEELEAQHQRDQQQFATFVPAERLSEVQKELHGAREESEVVRGQLANRALELEAASASYQQQLTAEAERREQVQRDAAALEQQLETSRLKCSEATEAAISAQEESSRLQHDLAVLQQNYRYLEAQLAAKSQEISGLVAEMDRQRTVIVSQQCSREHMLEMFPGDQAIRLTLRRLVEAEAEMEKLQRQVCVANATLATTVEKHKHLAEEHSRMEHRLTMADAATAAANENARARIAVLEERLAALQFQVQTERTAAEQANADLAAALAREAVHQAKIQALSTDPIATNVRKYGVQRAQDIQEQMEDLHRQKMTAVEEGNALRSQLSAAAETYNDLTRHADALAREMEAEKDKTVRAEKQLNAAQAEITALQQQLSSVTHQLGASRKSAFSEQERARTTAEQLQFTRKQLELREASLQTALREKDAAAATLTQLQIKLTAAEGRAAEVAAMEAKAQRQLDESRRTNELLIEDNLGLKDSAQKLSSLVVDLQTQIAAQRRAHPQGMRKPATSLTAELLRRHDG